MIFKPKISEPAFGCSDPVDANFNFIFQLFFYNIESPDNISILFLKNVTLNLRSINYVKNKIKHIIISNLAGTFVSRSSILSSNISGETSKKAGGIEGVEIL